MDASNNYKILTDEEAADVLIRTAKSSITSTLGAAFSKSFYIPTHYKGMIVDAKDVFAVGYTTASKVDVGNKEAILCAVFTNDPYVPVFGMIYGGEMGAFEVFKSKKCLTKLDIFKEVKLIRS